MKPRQLVRLGLVCAVMGIVNAMVAFSDENSHSNVTDQRQKAGPANDGKLSLDVARDRAKVTHDIYAATLRMLHDRYFHRDRSVLPARAMEDVFDEMQRQSNVEARWISASLKPMSIDHTPKSDFEKRASKEIAAGKMELEVVEDGYYRRAIAIPLTGGCLSCHEGLFQNSGRKKFAGLVISMPLVEKP